MTNDTPIFTSNGGEDLNLAEPHIDTDTNGARHVVIDPSNIIVDDETASKAPQAKVVAGTVGAGVGAATSLVTIYVLELALGIDIPDAVELAGGVIFTAALTFVSGYLTRNRA